jgi:hypothetical protein
MRSQVLHGGSAHSAIHCPFGHLGFDSHTWHTARILTLCPHGPSTPPPAQSASHSCVATPHIQKSSALNARWIPHADCPRLVSPLSLYSYSL